MTVLVDKFGEAGAEIERQIADVRGGIPQPFDPAPFFGRLDESESRSNARFEAIEKENAALREELRKAVQFTGRYDVRRAGVVLNDYKSATENSRILNDLFKRCAAWGVNEEIYFPGGAVWHDDTLTWPDRTGPAIQGNGICLPMNEVGYSNHPNATGGAGSRLIYCGTPDKPAHLYDTAGLRIGGLTLQNGECYRQGVPRVKADGSVGLKIAGNNTPPTGKLFAGPLAFYGFHQSILASALPAEWHADTCYFSYLIVRDSLGVYRCENQQAVGQKFGYIEYGGITQVDGQMGIVFDIDRPGGDLVCGWLGVMDPALILRQNRASDGYYKIHFLKTDNRAKGWRLLDMLQGGGITLEVAGNIGRDSEPGADPIILRRGSKDPEGKQHDLQLRLKRAFRTIELPRVVK